jgi:hypothetical protein
VKAISSDLRTTMKKLSLSKILDALPERIALAEKDSMPIEEFLPMIFVDEVERRGATATARRADQAGLDPAMVMERWDKTAKVTFDRRVLHELCTLRSDHVARSTRSRRRETGAHMARNPQTCRLLPRRRIVHTHR